MNKIFRIIFIIFIKLCIFDDNVKEFQTIRYTVDKKTTEKLGVKPVETTWFTNNPFEDMTTDELK